jgi:homoserine dehydrogenase
MTKIKIGLLGLGNVGSGVAQILQENAANIFKRTGKQIELKSVLVRDLNKKRNSNLTNVHTTTDAHSILTDPEIQIIVEVLGGEHPTYEYICQALQNKKFVVTANKEVMAKHHAELTQLAHQNGVDIYYEASVGGGIPIIQTLKVGYAANQLKAIYGILNGTTNYILTKIEEDHLEFNQALQEAQKLGFAEADPTMDISGLDTAYKLTILAGIAFKANLTLADISYEGIQSISLKDILYADEFGYKIKLLAMGQRTKNNEFCLSVQPFMLPKSHPLAAVRNEFNAIYVVGDAIQDAMLYGKGAGSLPTGSAVVSDIMDIAFNYPHNSRRNLETDFPNVKVLPADLQQNKFYLRLLVNDEFGVLEKIAGIFGKNKVSILKVIQKDIIAKQAELVILTHLVQQKDMQQAIIELKKLNCVQEVCAIIKVGLE